jgi:peptidoglycan/xylan/chitin deacetylase (PgdA/CDA1 family)
MKKIIVFFSSFLIAHLLFAQKSNLDTMNIKMLFPGGKAKALIMSYDDGMIADRTLVKLMNTYGIKGTFHLNSNKLDTKGYLTSNEIKTLFKGHEVSVHSANHPGLTGLSKKEIINEVIEDRRSLEKLTHKTVRGMAYPFGNYDDKVVEAISDLGIEYARTTNDSYQFYIPSDFLRWEPSIHQFAKAYYIENDTVNDNKELAIFNKVINNFIKSDTLALLDIWGHSWENDGPGGKWEKMEELFKLFSKNQDILYTTQIDLVDYIKAYQNLRYTVDKQIVVNPSALNVYIMVNSKPIKIPSGSQIVL